jgi:hypothetical protein
MDQSLHRAVAEATEGAFCATAQQGRRSKAKKQFHRGPSFCVRIEEAGTHEGTILDDVFGMGGQFQVVGQFERGKGTHLGGGSPDLPAPLSFSVTCDAVPLIQSGANPLTAGS